MRFVKAASVRRLIPAGAVTAVFAISLLAPTQAFSAIIDAGYGYGYANNCGVKGDGFHDHGKVCPNRPFPGHGKGVIRILSGGLLPSNANGATPAGHLVGKSKFVITANGATATTSSATGEGTNATGRGHTKGHGRGDARANRRAGLFI